MRRLRLIGLLIAVLGGFAALLFYGWYGRGVMPSSSNVVIRQYLRNPALRPDLITPGGIACEDAPFILPTEGLIGLLWSDPGRPYTTLRRHTGIDIFGDGPPGTVPIYAAYDGYLSRPENWLSTVIIRHDDPLQPGRTIWTYYTHMASRDGRTIYINDAFPPGTQDVFVEQGTLLGYQGEYAGNAPPVAMHLHFSIVTTDETTGSYRNEAVLTNTLDPSPYLGMPLHIDDDPTRPIRC